MWAPPIAPPMSDLGSLIGAGNRYNWDSTQWTEHLEGLLYAGETVEATVEIESARVLVTSHRVIVFTPETDDENVRSIERPNVTGVTATATGNMTMLPAAMKLGISGVLLVGIGMAFDPGELLGTPTVPDAPGAGGVIEMTQQLLGYLQILDDVLVALGGIALLGTTVLLGGYLLTREQVVKITVAGEDDVDIPVASDPSLAIDELGTALDPTGQSAPGETAKTEQQLQ